MMNVENLKLDGLKLITNKIFSDERGNFQELYHKKKYTAFGITVDFIQDNMSYSRKGVVRGLHFQWDQPLTKIMRVYAGSLFAVAVDIRIDSPTFGEHIHLELSDKKPESLYVPFGFATGICALSEQVGFVYKYSSFYNPKGESNIRWDDPTLNIDWPVTHPILSERDIHAQLLKDWLESKESKLFTMKNSKQYS